MFNKKHAFSKLVKRLILLLLVIAVLCINMHLVVSNAFNTGILSFEYIWD